MWVCGAKRKARDIPNVCETSMFSRYRRTNAPETFGISLAFLLAPQTHIHFHLIWNVLLIHM